MLVAVRTRKRASASLGEVSWGRTVGTPIKCDPPRKVTTADLMRLYHREAEKQRLLVKKSDYTQAKLLFLVEALKDLLADEGFTTLLRAERLDTMPRALAARIAGEQL